MTSFVTIPDSDILSGEPIKQETGRALRDNLLAVIEGDATAPSPSPAFFQSQRIGPLLSSLGVGTGTQTPAAGTLAQEITCENLTLGSGTYTPANDYTGTPFRHLLVKATGTVTIGSGCILDYSALNRTDPNSPTLFVGSKFNMMGGIGGNGFFWPSTQVPADGTQADIEAILNGNIDIFGGGAGQFGNTGGGSINPPAGGGAVVIVANTINITSATINVSGGNATGGSPGGAGGGGGGCIILAYNNLVETSPTYNRAGGLKDDPSGNDGQAGRLIKVNLSTGVVSVS